MGNDRERARMNESMEYEMNETTWHLINSRIFMKVKERFSWRIRSKGNCKGIAGKKERKKETEKDRQKD